MMDLTVDEHLIRAAVIAPKSAIDAFSAPALRERITNLLDSGVTSLVLDLSDTPFMDSAGMSVLVMALKRARMAGGNVRLVAPKIEAASRILKLTRFDQVFEFSASADEALAVWRKA